MEIDQEQLEWEGKTVITEEKNQAKGEEHLAFLQAMLNGTNK